jgi:hypothetical protein
LSGHNKNSVLSVGFCRSAGSEIFITLINKH